MRTESITVDCCGRAKNFFCVVGLAIGVGLRIVAAGGAKDWGGDGR